MPETVYMKVSLIRSSLDKIRTALASGCEITATHYNVPMFKIVPLPYKTSSLDDWAERLVKKNGGTDENPIPMREGSIGLKLPAELFLPKAASVCTSKEELEQGIIAILPNTNLRVYKNGRLFSEFGSDGLPVYQPDTEERFDISLYDKRLYEKLPPLTRIFLDMWAKEGT